MVHPTLTYDPAGRQGQTGTILHADEEKDELAVSFGNNQTGLYSGDALLMLKPGRDILNTLRNTGQQMDRGDYLEALRIYLLDAADEAGRHEALRLAMTKPDLMFATVMSVQEYIRLKKNSHDSMNFSRGR